MTGSRDPIRDYLREVEKQRRDTIIGWGLMILSAVVFLLLAWALMVWAFTA